MWSRGIVSTTARHLKARALSTEATAAATAVKLNFNLPHETLYAGAEVHQVILPGTEGEYGITANHVPYVAQLKPGVLQILHDDSGSDAEKYFVSGGYAFTHADSTTVRVVNFDFNNISY